MTQHDQSTPLETLQQCADTLKSIAFPVKYMPGLAPLSEQIEYIADTMATASQQLASDRLER